MERIGEAFGWIFAITAMLVILPIFIADKFTRRRKPNLELKWPF